VYALIIRLEVFVTRNLGERNTNWCVVAMQHLSPGNATYYPELVLRLQWHANSCCQSPDSEALNREPRGAQIDNRNYGLRNTDSQSVYFHLLDEVLGDVFNDFTYKHPSGYTVLTTARLHETLGVWAQKISTLDPIRWRLELQRVETSLQQVVSILRTNDKEFNSTMQS
jgi:hypothetical protein